MKIWLKDENKNPMWALPELGIFLSCLDNKPVAIDLHAMTQELRKTLWLDIQFGKIETDNFEELRSIMFPSAVKQEQQNQDFTVSVEEVDTSSKTAEITLSDVPEIVLPPEILQDESEDLKKMLDKGVASLKRELPVIANSSKWKKMLGLEQQNKNRKTVISLLHELITKFENEVSASILSGQAKAPDADVFIKNSLYSGRERMLLKNIDDMVESEEEIIEIKLE